MGLNEECKETAYVSWKIVCSIGINSKRRRIRELMRQSEIGILILPVQHQHLYFQY